MLAMQPDHYEIVARHCNCDAHSPSNEAWDWIRSSGRHQPGNWIMQHQHHDAHSPSNQAELIELEIGWGTSLEWLYIKSCSQSEHLRIGVVMPPWPELEGRSNWIRNKWGTSLELYYGSCSSESRWGTSLERNSNTWGTVSSVDLANCNDRTCI